MKPCFAAMASATLSPPMTCTAHWSVKIVESGVCEWPTEIRKQTKIRFLEIQSHLRKPIFSILLLYSGSCTNIWKVKKKKKETRSLYTYSFAHLFNLCIVAMILFWIIRNHSPRTAPVLFLRLLQSNVQPYLWLKTHRVLDVVKERFVLRHKGNFFKLVNFHLLMNRKD